MRQAPGSAGTSRATTSPSREPRQHADGVDASKRAGEAQAMSVSLADGTVFAGRYRLVRCIASGGMGAVYEAVHLETQRRRALKVMHPHLFGSEEMRERFKLEARIAAQVESEFIVDVSDAGVDEATRMPFLVMELLRGEELGDRLKRVGRLPPHEVVSHLQQAAWALDRTHAASIVHRDLKPANLFLTQREDGSLRIKILDFGVAKLIAEGATSAGATRSLGTPLYMAPEQFRTGAGLTGAADIYALGMMAYTLLVGEAYWHAEARGSGNVIAFALAAALGPMEPATRRAASRGVMLPPTFDAWFARVAAVNPADRHPTASEAVRTLAEVLGVYAGGGMTSVSPAAGTSGPFGPGAARADASWPSVPGSGAQPAMAMIDRAATSTGAAMTAAPAPRRGSPLLVIFAVLGVTTLVVGLLILRTLSSPLRASASSASATPASPPAVAQPTTQPSAGVASAEPTMAPDPAPIATVAPADPMPTAKPTPPRPAAHAPAAKPTAAARAPRPATTSAPLLGRD